MFRSTSGGDDFYDFGDPFPSSWGFGQTRSLPLSFFGVRDPFDPFFTDHFFTSPLRNIMGSSILNRSIFGSHRDTFGEPSNFGFIEHQPLQQHRTSGPIIQNILDDDDSTPENSQEHEEDPEKISGSGKKLYVKDPVEKSGEAGAKELGISSGWQPQTNRYTFHSSTVRYGGINGAYYTSSTTRKMGGDGVMVEESKEADTSSRRATHRISRGIHDKGHSFSRRLNSDGRVDTMQTLHNLNDDELPWFEEAWRGNAGETLMGWNPVMGMHEPKNTRGNNHHGGRSSRIIEVEVLPSASEQIEISKRTGSEAQP